LVASVIPVRHDLFQSCLPSKEAYKIIRHLEMQFPPVSEAIIAILEAGDSAEVVASWGEPAVEQNHFAIKDCWG
jgi:hypothetical protein